MGPPCILGAARLCLSGQVLGSAGIRCIVSRGSGSVEAGGGAGAKGLSTEQGLSKLHVPAHPAALSPLLCLITRYGRGVRH